MRTFSALRHRNYRLLWSGLLVSGTGDWIDQIALNWLVVQTTDSPVWLGLVNLCRGLPILAFTLLGGVMADRAERRGLVVATQIAAMILAIVLALLVYIDYTPIGVVLVIATLRGAISSFNLPARQSLISEIVPREDLANAIALHSITRNMTKIVGPAIAGVLIAWVGMAACFAINALSFLAVLYTLVRMTVTAAPRATRGESVTESLVDGVRFVRGHAVIGFLVLIAVVPMFFGQPYITLLALFTRDEFRLGPEALGLLTSCAAAGSVIGALLLATFPAQARRGVTMLAYMTGFGVCLLAFALAPWFALAPVILVGAGALQIAYNATNNTILQMIVPDHMRGRVLSTLYIGRGLVQIGTFSITALAAVAGVRAALALAATIIVGFGLLLFARADAIRKLEI